MPDPLKLRGQCRTCDTVIDTTAEKGRATRKMPCPKGHGDVLCRRLVVAAGTVPPAAPPTPADPATGPAPRPRRKPIPKAGDYAPYPGQGPGTSPGGAGTGPADGANPGVQQPGGTGDPAGGTGGPGKPDGPADGPGKPDTGGTTPPAKPPAQAGQPEVRKRRGHPYGDIFGWDS